MASPSSPPERIGEALEAFKSARALRAPDESTIESVELTPVERDARARGLEAVARGELAVLLLAGGQGTRLGWAGPKGTFPLTEGDDGTLFDYHARSLLALRAEAAEHAGVASEDVHIPWLVLTGAHNDEATRAFFRERYHWGLPSEDVWFFQQGRLPCLTKDGSSALPGAFAPDGNGGVWTALRVSGLLPVLRARGVTSLYLWAVDNPLTVVGDPAFLGTALAVEAEAALKVVERADEHEKCGVVVREGRSTRVAEYSECPDILSRSEGDGALTFPWANICVHLFTLEFVERAVTLRLPAHLAWKKIPYCAVADGCELRRGARVEPEEPNGWKIEYFVFDVFPFASSVAVVACDRACEFAPVKNAEGRDSPATARAAIDAMRF